METSVEARLAHLEDRVRTLEGLLGIGSKPPLPAAPEPFPAPPPAPAPHRAPAPRRDLEELLGGRILGWTGGIAVVVAAVFFLVMAVRNGWIGREARVELAFAASLALLGAGTWLYERRGKTQAALAAAAAGFAALYASDTAGTALYHLVSPLAGLLVAGAVGAAALAAAVRWQSQEIAGIGIVGSLLAPVLVQAGVSTSALVFMAIALLAAVGVVVERGWAWLGPVAYIVSAPQAADWINHEHVDHLAAALAVTAGFWLVYVAASLGHELRRPQTSLRISSASLLFINASVTAAGGWWLLHDTGHGTAATGWIFGLAAAHVALALVVLGTRVSRETAVVLAGEAAAQLAVAVALALGGPALVAAWAVEGVVLAWIGARGGDRRGRLAAFGLLALAAGHVVVFDVPPTALAYGLPSLGKGIVAAAIFAAALAALAWIDNELAEPLWWAAAGVGVYLCSGLVVTAGGAQPHAVTQTSQLALSGFWAALGLAALVAGLVVRRRALRLGGLGLLALAVGKVFIVDLSKLESMWRVGSFLALGLLLLAGAFAYQRGSRTVEA